MGCREVAATFICAVRNGGEVGFLRRRLPTVSQTDSGKLAGRRSNWSMRGATRRDPQRLVLHLGSKSEGCLSVGKRIVSHIESFSHADVHGYASDA